MSSAYFLLLVMRQAVTLTPALCRIDAPVSQLSMVVFCKTRSRTVLGRNRHLRSKDAAIFYRYAVAPQNYGRIGLIESASCCCSGILHVVIELGILVLAHAGDAKSSDGDAIADSLLWQASAERQRVLGRPAHQWLMAGPPRSGLLLQDLLLSCLLRWPSLWPSGYPRPPG